MASWQEELCAELLVFGIPFNFQDELGGQLLCFEDRRLVLNLVSLSQAWEPEAFVTLQEAYASRELFVVHVWEDIWRSHRKKVLSRIASILGFNTRLHGRKTRLVKITQQEADVFWEQHHLQGTAKSKYRYALELSGELVAAAGFSNLRYMKKGGPEYRSAELIRFATRSGDTVTGGFTKLLRHFIALHGPDDIMSYADRDWSLGEAYENAGFRLQDKTPPAEIWLDTCTMERYFLHRLPPGALDDPLQDRFIRIFNTGNLKYVLYLRPELGHG